MKNLNPVKALRYFTYSLFILFLTSCEVAREGPQHPSVINGLLDKAKLFIDLAVIIFAQDSRYWGDAFKNIYYAALSLGRIKNINTLVVPSKKFHQNVWKISPIIVRRYFNDTLRLIRIRFDYSVNMGENISFLEEAEQFRKEAKTPFAVLIEVTREQIKKNYKNCNGITTACIYCSITPKNDCQKKRALEDLNIIQGKIEDLIDNKLPSYIDKEKVSM